MKGTNLVRVALTHTASAFFLVLSMEIPPLVRGIMRAMGLGSTVMSHFITCVCALVLGLVVLWLAKHVECHDDHTKDRSRKEHSGTASQRRWALSKSMRQCSSCPLRSA